MNLIIANLISNVDTTVGQFKSSIRSQSPEENAEFKAMLQSIFVTTDEYRGESVLNNYTFIKTRSESLYGIFPTSLCDVQSQTQDSLKSTEKQLVNITPPVVKKICHYNICCTSGPVQINIITPRIDKITNNTSINRTKREIKYCHNHNYHPGSNPILHFTYNHDSRAHDKTDPIGNSLNNGKIITNITQSKSLWDTDREIESPIPVTTLPEIPTILYGTQQDENNRAMKIHWSNME